MIAQSQSGTGKTATFVLAMLNKVDPSKNYPQVLCLSPTFELTLQTAAVVKKMATFLPEITMRLAVRGEESTYILNHIFSFIYDAFIFEFSVPRGSIIRDHIIIGTPGKIHDWALKFRFFNISDVSMFVLDEADIMIATQGHQDLCIRVQK